MRRRAGKTDVVVWIALSSSGNPAPICGYAFTKRRLKEMYSERFASDLEVAGYKPVRVKLTCVDERK